MPAPTLQFCAYRNCYKTPSWWAANWYPYCSPECADQENAARRRDAKEAAEP